MDTSALSHPATTVVPATFDLPTLSVLNDDGPGAVLPLSLASENELVWLEADLVMAEVAFAKEARLMREALNAERERRAGIAA